MLRDLPAPATAVGAVRVPALCPDFLIETYLDHQGEQFCLKYDANSLIYISKAMDLFDMTLSALESLNLTPPSPVPESHLTSETSPLLQRRRMVSYQVGECQSKKIDTVAQYGLQQVEDVDSCARWPPWLWPSPARSAPIRVMWLG